MRWRRPTAPPNWRRRNEPVLSNPEPSPRGLTRESVGAARDSRVKPVHDDEFDNARTIGEVLAEASDKLEAAGFDAPRRLARRVIAATLQLSASEVFAHPERRLSAVETARLMAIEQRVLAHEPLSRITGRREFWSREFSLSTDTLDPRPDSETLVAAVLARLADRGRPYRLLDLGTGSGCLLLALLAELPRAWGIGIDIAPGAAATARHNAGRLGLAARTAFIAGNWADAIAAGFEVAGFEVAGFDVAGFDVIVANPPYIPTAALAELPPEVRLYDPPRALDGGGDGLGAYRAIGGDVQRLVGPGGLFALEIGQGQAEPVASMLSQAGLRIEEIASDLAGIPRCVIARRSA